MRQQRLAAWFGRCGYAIYAIVALSMVLTFLSWQAASAYQERHVANRLDRAVGEAESLIRDRMGDYKQVLRTGVAFVVVVEDLSTAEWRKFSQAMQLPRFFPGIQGFGFTRALTEDQIGEFQAAMEADGHESFQVFPRYPRPLYTAIQFLEPWDFRNQRAFGYDMFEEPTRREAMERARDTGSPALTGRVILVQEVPEAGDVQSGTLMYLPVYRSGSDPGSIEQRREELVGWVYAPFRMRDLMAGILESWQHPLEFEVFDGAQRGGEHRLFVTGDFDRVAQEGRVLTRSMTVGGRDWRIDYAVPQAFARPQFMPEPGIVALAALIIYPLVFAVLYLLGRERRRAVAAMERARRELQTIARLHEAIHNHAGTAILSTDSDGTVLSMNPAAEQLLGYPASAVVNKMTPAQFHDPAELESRALQRARERGEAASEGLEVVVAPARRGSVENGEWTYTRSDGAAFPVLLTVTALRDETGGISGFLHIAQDVSALHEAAQQLDQSRRQIESLTRAMDLHGLVSVRDRDGRFREVNERFCTVSGYTRAELVGNEQSILHSGIHSESFFRDMEATVRAGRVWSGEICFRAKNNTLYWVASTVVPFVDATGEPSQFVSIETEITARKRDFALLQETQKLARVGGWEYYMPTGELIWSEAIYAIHGRPIGTQPTMDEALAFYHPDSQPLIRAAFERSMEDGTSWDLEVKLITADRRTLWVRSKGAVEYLGRQPCRILGTLQNIDDQRQQIEELAAREERYRMLAALSPVGIFEADVTGKCLFTNRAWGSIAGAAGDDWKGREWTLIVHPEDRARIARAWSVAFATRIPFQDEVRVRRTDGSVRWVMVRVVPIRRHGAVTGYVGVGEDVTDRKFVVSQLTGSVTELEDRLRTAHRWIDDHLQLVTETLRIEAEGTESAEQSVPLARCVERLQWIGWLHQWVAADGTTDDVDWTASLRTLFEKRVSDTSGGSTMPELAIASVHLNVSQRTACFLLARELVAIAEERASTESQTSALPVLQLTKAADGEVALSVSLNQETGSTDSSADRRAFSSTEQQVVALLAEPLAARIHWSKPTEPLHVVVRFHPVEQPPA